MAKILSVIKEGGGEGGGDKGARNRKRRGEGLEEEKEGE